MSKGKWNYRVFKKWLKEHKLFTYEVLSAYYDDINDDVPTSYGGIGFPPSGETNNEIASDMKKMQVAFTKPVLLVKFGVISETDEMIDTDVEI